MNRQFKIRLLSVFSILSMLLSALGIPTQTALAANAGTALQFNSTSQYVTFGQATTTLGATNFTVEAWVKRASGGSAISTGTAGLGTGSYPSAYPVVTKGRGEAETPANLNTNYFVGIATTGVIAADFEDTINGTNHPVIGATVIPLNEWHHIAVTYDGQTWRLYLDGTLDKTTTLASPFAPEATSIQHAGIASALNSTGVASGYFSGIIDEARVWNVVRSGAEIQANKTNELTSGTGLLGRWGLNEGTGNAISNSIAGSPAGIWKTEATIPPAAWVSGFPLPDTTPPAAPTSLIATPGSGVVNLSWTAPADSDVAGYSIYRSASSPVALTSPINGGTLVTATSYTDTGRTNGTKYYYVVTAMDTSTNQSAASNEANTTPSAGLGSGLNFDGTNDYVTFGQAADLGAKTFTLETWFKRAGAGATTYTGTSGVVAVPLVTKGMAESDAVPADMNYFFGIESGTNFLVADFEECSPSTQAPDCLAGGTAGLNHPVKGTTAIQNDVWYHGAVTYDGQYFKIYLNGNLDGQLNVGAVRYPRWDSTQHAALGTALQASGSPGSSSGYGPGYFQGALDEARIWNVARTQTDIQTAINSELASGAGLIGRWGMNEGSGTTLTDATAPLTNGTLTNGLTWGAGAPFNIVIGDLPPAAPTGLTAAGQNGAVSLTWNTNTEPDLAGYNVYRSTAPSVPLTSPINGGTLVTATTYLDSGRTNGITYYYVVAAVDNAANQSTASNEVNATPTGSTSVLIGAGDIASGTSTGDEATALLLDSIPNATVFTLGDNVYQDGSASDFTSYYDPTWGRHKARTYPSTGNHDYQLGNANGYFGYFGASAGDPAKGYYSYDLGTWHIVVLNSNCSFVPCDAASAQVTWLKADLAANPTKNVVAYWHVPRFSSGANHGNDISVQAFWDALYQYGADVVINGHSHNYERFAPQNPAGQADNTYGIRQFIVGTGGLDHIGFGTIVANSEVRDSTSWGILKLTLNNNSYDWQFIPVAGSSFTDSGSDSTHAAPPTGCGANCALDFNGTNSYVTFGTASGLGVTNFTLETWFYWTGGGVTTTTSGTQGLPSVIPLVSKGRGEADGSNLDMNFFMGIDTTANTLAADFEDTASGMNHPVSAVTPITTNTWHHAAVTYNSVSGVWNLYLDGVLDRTLDIGDNILPRSDSIQHAGLGTAMTSTGVAAGYLQGRLDEVRIWNRVLSSTEITTNINSQLTSGSGLVARWGLDEGTGTAIGSSVGTFTGTLTNGPTWVAGAPFNINSNTAPSQPTLVSPSNGGSISNLSPTLSVNVSDPESDPLTVQFYGRTLTSSASPFSLVFLPDTQNYTTAANQPLGATIFNTQTNWVVNNVVTRNIAFVDHLGDITENGGNDTDNSEWIIGDAALDILDSGNVLYSVEPGNHDLAGGATRFENYFGVARFAGKSYYGGHYGTDNTNNYNLFSASGMDFILINISCPSAAPSADVLTWANNLLATNSNRRGIVVCHDLLTTSNVFSTAGTAVYNALRGNSNLFLMLGGHLDQAGSRSDTYNSNTVFSLRSDYQSQANGGNGWLRILEFQPANNKIQVYTYSPYLNNSMTDATNQFSLNYSMSGTWQLIGTTNVASGATASVTWSGLTNTTQYEWYAVASDSASSTNSATWNFTTNATGTNQPPVITEGTSVDVTMSEDGTPTAFSKTLNATDANAGDTLTWSISTAASHGAASATGTGFSKLIGYTPVANFNGSDSFIVQVSDGMGGMDTITVNVTITSINDDPTLTNPGAKTNAENDVVSLQAQASDVDLPAQTLTYSATNLPDGLSINTSTGLISGTVSATASTNSPYSVTLGVSDGNGGSASANFTWAITDVVTTPADLTCTTIQPKPMTASTGEKPQSKVWNYNGAWYAVFPTNASGATSAGTWLWKLQGTSWTEVLKLSDATNTKADVKSIGNLAHILLYNDPATQLASVEFSGGTYQLWSARQTLTSINLPGSEIATIDIDSTGRMWLATRQDSPAPVKIVVYYSDSPYTTFQGPVEIDSDVIGGDDISVITAMPGNKIGILWSNQNTERFGFRVHLDGASPTTWSANELPASQSAIENVGTGMADDHLNVKIASDSTLYAAVKTGYDTAGYPKMALLVRRPNGTWDNLYGIDEAGTRANIELDEARGVLTFIYTQSEGFNPIVYRQSNLSPISFGAKQTLRTESFNDVSSTKQNYNNELVVIYASGTQVGGQICTAGQASGADLAITKTDGITTVRPGDTLTYTIQVTNNGPQAVTGATVTDTLPATLKTVSWTCAGVNAGTCTASGSGNINDVVNLPVNASVNYTVSATVDLGARGSLTNTATVTPPVGITDSITSNNTATDTDTIIADGTSCGSDPSLVGCWQMEEGSGTVLVDGSSFTNDASVIGAPAWVTGKVGTYALDLNGTSQYGVVPDDASLDLTNQITIATWIKPEQYATQDLIKKATNGVTDGYELSLATTKTDASSQRVFFRINQVANGDTYRINATTIYPIDGTWMHVAATYDGATMRLYINGVLESSLATTIPMATNNLPLTIGAQDGTTSSRWFMGWMDDARVYNRALSQNEVLHLAGMTPTYALTVNKTGTGSGTVSSDPAGIDCGATCSYNFNENTLVTLTATLVNGSTFTGWSGACTGTGACLVTMNEAKSVTANLMVAGVLLVSPSGGLTSWNNSFSWTGVNGATWYLVQVQTTDDTVVLQKWYTADAAGCSGDLSCVVSPAETLNLSNGNYKWRILDYGDYGYGSWTSYTSFNLNAACYTLAANVLPVGSGTFHATAQNCSGDYIAGTVVQLTAIPNAGYAFTNWSGDATGTVNPVSVTMDANKSVVANFTVLGATLIAPTGEQTSWADTFSWTGINGATWYLVQLQAADDSVVLQKWYTADAAGCAGDLSCAVLPTETLDLANGDYKWRILDYGGYGYGSWTPFMNFNLSAACYVLTTNVLPAGSGAVTASTQNCSGGYISGTVVQVTALSNSGYGFASWSGDATGITNPVSIVMDANKSVTANMLGLGATLISPAGTLTSWNNTFSWTGVNGATWYLVQVQTNNDMVVLQKWYTADAAGCSGGLSCAVAPAETLTLSNGDYKWRILDYGGYGYGSWSIYKDFSLNTACYTLTTDVLPAGSGTITASTQNCSGGYIAGTMVQVSVVPNAGYVFASWSGDATGTSNPVSITMDGNKVATANLAALGAVLIAPAGTLTSWDNTFSWTGITGASWYLVQVQTSDGTTVLQQWYTADATGCSGDLSCAVSPVETLNLANGSYKWRILDYGGYGYGSWSPYTTFLLNR